MNSSGIKPINCNVLVSPDIVEEKQGAIFLPDEARERNQHGQTVGTLVARCDDAFQEMETPPEPGARIAFARYSGAEITGVDGEKYRLLKDIDVTGIFINE